MTRRPDLRLAARGGWIEALRLPAALFGAAARIRGGLYRRGWLPSYDVGVPVVSVGNLSVGGTGKTPMIAWLARELIGGGRRPGIVSRGYRAPHSEGDAAGGVNDEAQMLAELLPDVLHVQNRDRVAGARELVDHGIDVILVDDGFQHRRLARDVDIVLVDALRPFGLPAPAGGGAPVQAMLPRGLMREPLSALSRAQAAVITRSDAVGAAELDSLRTRLTAAAPGVPIALARHAPSALRRFDAGPGTPAAALELTHLADLEVDLVSGIGNPGAFEATVRALGGRVREHRAFPDHHGFAQADLAGLGDARPVVTTAKDAARLTLQPGIAAPKELLVLEVELDIVEGRARLVELLAGLGESQSMRVRASIHEGLHG